MNNGLRNIFTIILLTFKILTGMRKINMIVVHCTATRCNQNYTVEQLYHDHVEVNHWCFIGYHSTFAETAR